MTWRALLGAKSVTDVKQIQRTDHIVRRLDAARPPTPLFVRAIVDRSETELGVTLKDGRRIAALLWWLPRLLDATPEQRAKWDIMPFGDAVQWPEIDEHVSVKGLLRGKPALGAKPPGAERP